MPKKISDYQKLLMQKILGPDPRHVELMFLVHQMDNCEAVLYWFIKKGYVGKHLSDWITRDHGGNFMQAHQWISKNVKQS